MKRVFDIFLATALIIFLAAVILLIGFIVRITSKGPIIYWSGRIGIDNKVFKMPKFRSMRFDTPEIATHLMKNPNAFFSPVGGLLRRTSLDELPQLFSILKGDMSFVGPRPALYNQDDLIELRKIKGIDKIKPGVTGLAQVSGRDDLSIEDKVTFDEKYIELQSFWFDLKILWLTLIKVIKGDNVSH